MNAAEATCSLLKFLLSGPGLLLRNSHMIRTMKMKPTTTPAIGERIRARTIFFSPFQCSVAAPGWAMTAPIRPPMMACDDEEGNP